MNTPRLRKAMLDYEASLTPSTLASELGHSEATVPGWRANLSWSEEGWGQRPVDRFATIHNRHFAGGLPSLPDIFLTGWLIGLLTVFYLFEVVVDGGVTSRLLDGPSIEAVVAMGGNTWQLTAGRGEWWRLLSAVMLHGSFMHLLMNSVSLYSVGGFVERVFDRSALLTVFVLTGLAASGTTEMLASHHTVSIGASGSVCGILGFLIAIGVRGPNEFVARLKANTINLVMLAFIGMAPNVDNWGHIGGLLSGVALAFAYPHFGKRVRAVLALFSGVLLACCALWMTILFFVISSQ